MPSLDFEHEIGLAVAGGSETARVDFKESFDPSSRAEWLEVIKDVVAMSNAGGGSIVFGLADDGIASSFSATALHSVDQATVMDKLFSHTGSHAFAITLQLRTLAGKECVCFDIAGGGRLHVFTTSGTYQDGTKTKNAFQLGAVYWRHGAKSEPAVAEDLELHVAVRLENERSSWLSRIRQVIEAPADSRVMIVGPVNSSEPSQTPSGDDMRLVRLSDAADAAPMAPGHLAVAYPHRRKEALGRANDLLGGAVRLTTHDFDCVRKLHSIDENLGFSFRPPHGTRLYTEAFPVWLATQYQADHNFFTKARTERALQLRGQE